MPTKYKPVDLARLKKFSQINWLNLTEKDLTELDLEENTLLHYTVQHQPEAIPKELLTPEMFYKNKVGKTPLHSWAEGHHWESIPDHLLNKESINLNPPNSPLAYIIGQYVQNIAYEKEKSRTVEMTKKITRLLTLSNEKELRKLMGKLKTSGLDWDSEHLEQENFLTAILIQKELYRRKIVKELCSKEQNLDI
jgi:hypothetical protein